MGEFFPLRVMVLNKKLSFKKGRLALRVLLDTLITGETKLLASLTEIDVVGHRVVHGGAK